MPAAKFGVTPAVPFLELSAICRVATLRRRSSCRLHFFTTPANVSDNCFARAGVSSLWCKCRATGDWRYVRILPSTYMHTVYRIVASMIPTTSWTGQYQLFSSSGGFSTISKYFRLIVSSSVFLSAQRFYQRWDFWNPSWFRKNIYMKKLESELWFSSFALSPLFVFLSFCLFHFHFYFILLSIRYTFRFVLFSFAVHSFSVFRLLAYVCCAYRTQHEGMALRCLIYLRVLHHAM